LATGDGGVEITGGLNGRMTGGMGGADEEG
jgi:hypothetical protein